MAIATLLLAVTLSAGVSSPAPTATRSLLVKTEPPRQIANIALRALETESAPAVSIPVRGERALVPADAPPLPWKIELEGFEPVTYSEADARQQRPVVLRALGKVKGTLERPRRGLKEKAVWLLKRADLGKVQQIPFAVSAQGGFELSLAAGVYQGAVLGKSCASRIRSGLIVRPGSATDLGKVLCQPTVPLSFRVLDAKTQRPVPGAVALWDPPGELQNAGLARALFAGPWSAAPDAQGRVVFPSLGPLPLAVRWRVEAKGFAATHTARLVLREGGRTSVPDVGLRAEATVTVRVSAPKGEKLPAGRIVLEDPDPGNPLRFVPKASAVLREGETSLSSMTYGRKRLLINAATGAALYYTDFVVSSEREILEVFLEPVLIGGRVTRRGEPAEGVGVILADPHDSRVTLSKAQSGSDGQYELTTYQTGRLNLYAIVGGGPGKSSGATLREIEVDTGQREYEVNFDLAAAGLTLLVSDASAGTPVAHAQVESRLDFPNGTRDMRISQTDERGRLDLTDFPEGTATLQIRAKGYKAKDLKLPIRKGGGDFSVALERSAEVAGVVRGPQGHPVAGARILGGFENEFSGQAFFEASTDPSGRFRFDSAPPSGMRFYVAAAGYALTITVLQPGDDNSIILSPLSPAILHVVSESGPPAAGLRVAAAPRGDQIIPVGALGDLAELNGMDGYQLLATGPDGVVALPAFLEPGVYDFFVTLRGEGPLPVYRKIGSLELPLSGPEVLVYRRPKS